ncbi:MAG: glycerol-3-phosphate dehydrogenase [Gammaproteobacteria bacterium RIFCSPHIGHO2_02_FULL_42_13]|nr:MAG: glycerol-3-phosphate dehydrogenase [Gammaproteobacteria bacterium RIFCSPHIGHO2_02_FULL_42_13]OGT70442.1 MAG: glycerol-3-phosphate dehydrogenase [Gammaproteobacteria bacterium RIFCSPLOWO2_02_FULL_42_9]
MTLSTPIAVLGAGSWGTALAAHLARHEQPVHLWEYDKAQVLAMQRDRCNEKYAPGFAFPELMKVTHSLKDAVFGVQDILIVVPSFAFRQTLQSLKPLIDKSHRIVWATKGIDEKNGQLFHEVVLEVLGRRAMAILSGPSFAKEIIQKLPAAVSLASEDKCFLDDLVNRFNRGVLRVYTSNDIVGVQLGGAGKNVIAIAAGISDGLSLGANARSALITRGLAEIVRLGLAMGASRETFMGLSGIGDLILTCLDDQSRNRRCGLALACGETLEQAKKQLGQVVEGANVAEQFLLLAKKHHVDMPICELVSRVLHQELTASEALSELLSRQPKEEKH